jgi:hypothetical protein
MDLIDLNRNIAKYQKEMNEKRESKILVLGFFVALTKINGKRTQNFFETSWKKYQI